MGGIPMPRTRRWIALGLLLATPLLYAQTTAPATHSTTPHRKSHKAPKPLVLPPLPSGPLLQVPMDQLPPMPAKVGCQGGLLTIAAQNSTLGEILRDVRKLTGASIDIPPGSGGERVVAYLGPGAPRDVLAALLNGTSLNYVMLGSSAEVDDSAKDDEQDSLGHKAGGGQQLVENDARTGAAAAIDETHAGLGKV